MSLVVQRVTAAGPLASVFAVRQTVFVGEQHVPWELELDELDAVADHFLARDGGRAVGAGRLVITGDVGVLGRLAVLASCRGRGVGTQLVEVIERRAKEVGMVAVELHAQTHALAFYERLGYSALGEEFTEAGIAHRGMRKEI